jgi:hypothetical protein
LSYTINARLRPIFISAHNSLSQFWVLRVYRPRG